MEDADRRTLQLNRVFLVKNIANPDDIAEGLYSREIFTEGMKDEIEVNNKKVQEWMSFIYNHQSSCLYCSWGCNHGSLSETRRGWKFWLTPLQSLGSKTRKMIWVFLPKLRSSVVIELSQAEVFACLKILL